MHDNNNIMCAQLYTTNNYNSGVRLPQLIIAWFTPQDTADNASTPASLN
jgi:hypothetical protein